MNLKSLFSLFTLSLLLISTVIAQTPAAQDSAKSGQKKTDQAKQQESLEKKALALLEDVLKEAANLRLAENRIRAQASAAEMLWKHDEKRARALFKQAADSFVELLANEEESASNQTYVIIDGPAMNQLGRYPALSQVRTQLRQELLQMLGAHDAKLARDFLRATSRPVNREEMGYSNMNGDTEMDLSIAARVAESDPKQALEIAEENLEKGLPYGLANVLSQLQKKDRESAAKLTGGIMKKLRSENMATNHEAAMFALMLLQQQGEAGGVDSSSDEARAASARTSALDENTVRELIDMIVTAALSQAASKTSDSDDEDSGGATPLLGSINSLMPQIEKYAPSRAPLLRKKMTEYETTLDPNQRAYKEFESVIEKGDSRAIMEAASKADPEMKKALAGQAIAKAFAEGEFDRARQLINEFITDAGQRKQMLASLDRQMLQRASMLGKLDEARTLLSRLPPEERAAMLAQFAMAAIGRGDKKLALQLLDEARNSVSAQATNYVELGALLQIARSYVAVDPARSFDIIEPTIDQLNTLVAAVATLDGFEYWQHFKDGEMIGAGPSVVITTTLQCARDLAPLSRADFDRARAAADRFSRSEVRVMARLSVVQGVLSTGPLITALPMSGRQVFRTQY